MFVIYFPPYLVLLLTLDSLEELFGNVSTPVAPSKAARTLAVEEYSPVFALCTQEDSAASVDVVWDWSSPQSVVRPVKHKPKALRRLRTSPKSAFRRPQACRSRDLETLEEALRSLKGSRPSFWVSELDWSGVFLGENNNGDLADLGMVDDSFDSALGAFTEEEFELLSQAATTETNQDCDRGRIQVVTVGTLFAQGNYFYADYGNFHPVFGKRKPTFQTVSYKIGKTQKGCRTANVPLPFFPCSSDITV